MKNKTMKTPKVLEQYPKKLLEEIQFVEDTMPNYPYWYKVQFIEKNFAFDKVLIEKALSDYQQFMEI